MDNDNPRPSEASSNVVLLEVETSLDLPLENILQGTRQAEVTDCVVLGYDSAGEFYLASATADTGTILVLLERCRRLLINRLCEGG